MLIADEPTTALDVTIQAQILDLMLELKEKTGTAIVLITHDLGVVAETTQRVVVMYAGRKVEEAPVEVLFDEPLHPYTRGLMRAIPRLDVEADAAGTRPRLQEIPGLVPNPDARRSSAAPSRRAAASPRIVAAAEPPPIVDAGAGHTVACWEVERVQGERAMSTAPVLEVEKLVKHFPIHGGLLQRRVGEVRAVDGVSFAIAQGRDPGTGGRIGLRQVDHRQDRAEADRAHLRPHPAGRRGRDRAQARRHVAASPAHPDDLPGPLLVDESPAVRPARSWASPWRISASRSGRDTDDRVARLFERVGLRPDAMRKYAHEFSGGQRQRLGIAKALSVSPDLIVADEPVSALDVSVQAQVLNLLIDLQEELGLAYLFISHDLAVMRHISHRIAVMYLGRIVELADKRTLFTQPLHPYTEALLSAATAPDPKRRRQRKRIVQGDVPSPAKPPPGCHFHTRCPYAIAECRVTAPPLIEVAPGHHVACLRRPVGGDPGPLPIA